MFNYIYRGVKLLVGSFIAVVVLSVIVSSVAAAEDTDTITTDNSSSTDDSVPDYPSIAFVRFCPTEGVLVINDGNVAVTVKANFDEFTLGVDEQKTVYYNKNNEIMLEAFDANGVLFFEHLVTLDLEHCQPVVTPKPSVSFTGTTDCEGLISGTGVLNRDGVEGVFVFGVSLRGGPIGQDDTFSVSGVQAPMDLKVFAPNGDAVKLFINVKPAGEQCVAPPPVPSTTVVDIPGPADVATPLSGTYGGCMSDSAITIKFQVSGSDIDTAIWTNAAGPSHALKPGETSGTITVFKVPAKVVWQVGSDMVELKSTGFVSCNPPTVSSDMPVPTGASPVLPTTGSSVVPTLLIAIGLLGAGGTALAVSRRRQPA